MNTHYDTLKEAIARITYQPNFQLKAMDWGIDIGMTAPDCSNPAKTVTVWEAVKIASGDLTGDPKIDTYLIVKAIRKGLRRLALHEVDKWLRLDGKQWRHQSHDGSPTDTRGRGGGPAGLQS